MLRWSLYILICKLGLSVGLDFFQWRMHSFTLYVCSVSNRRLQWAISKTVLPNTATYDNCLFNAQKWLQRLEFDGNRIEQLDSVQPLLNCATVSAESLLIKVSTTIMTKYPLSLRYIFRLRIVPSKLSISEQKPFWKNIIFIENNQINLCRDLHFTR